MTNKARSLQSLTEKPSIIRDKKPSTDSQRKKSAKLVSKKLFDEPMGKYEESKTQQDYKSQPTSLQNIADDRTCSTKPSLTEVEDKLKDLSLKPKSTSELETTIHSDQKGSLGELPEEKEFNILDYEEDVNVYETLIDRLRCKILCCRIDPTDKYVAAACEDGRVRVYQAVTGEKIREIKFSDNIENVEMALRWRPNTDPSLTQNVLIAGDTVGSIYLVHATSGNILYNIEQKDNEIYSIDYAYDGTKFAVGGMDSKVTVYDEHKKKEFHVLQAGLNSPAHSKRVLAVKFSKDDPNLLMSAGWDNVIILWDLRTHKSTGYIYGPQIYGEALDIQGNLILAGSSREEKQLQLFDNRTLKTLVSIDWDQNPEISKKAYVYSAQFGKHDKTMVGAAATGVNQIKVFDHEDRFLMKQKVNKRDKAVYCLDFFNKSNKYVYCGSKGNLGIVYV